MANCLFYTGFEEFNETLSELGMPRFRGKQIYEWIFKKFVFSFDEMNNISLVDREKLKNAFPRILPPVERYLVDKVDKTSKAIIKLKDGEIIEAVAIPGENSLTFCLSTQVGCAVGCPFCKTGESGLIRDLSADEIILQVMMLVRRTGKKPTNIVFMGMGEPFFNSDELYGAIDVLTDPKGLGLASRRLTISTSGHVDGILGLINRPGEVNLAVSIHVADNEGRDRLVPMNKRYPLNKLKSALLEYCDRTTRRVTLEVVLLKNVNDQDNDLINLINFCEGLIVHVNLIQFNSFLGSKFESSSIKIIRKFKKELKRAGIAATIRSSRGQNVMAACGQLGGKSATD